jgi:hypothetical protein
MGVDTPIPPVWMNARRPEGRPAAGSKRLPRSRKISIRYLSGITIYRESRGRLPLRCLFLFRSRGGHTPYGQRALRKFLKNQGVFVSMMELQIPNACDGRRDLEYGCARNGLRLSKNIHIIFMDLVRTIPVHARFSRADFFKICGYARTLWQRHPSRLIQ